MAEAYCVKDKMKVEVQNPDADHHEERQAGAVGHLPEVRHARCSRSAADATAS